MGILIARAMGPTVLGAWGYVVWIASMAIQVGNFGIPSALIKYLGDALGQRRFEEVGGLIRGTIIFQVFVALGLAAIGLVWALFYLPAGQRTFAVLAVLSIVPAAMLGIATAMNSAMENQRYNAIPSIIGVLTQTLVGICTLIFHWGLVGLAAALLLCRTLDCIIRAWLAFVRFPVHLRKLGWDPKSTPTTSHLSRELRREVVNYCMHASMLLALRLIVWNRSEVFFLKQLCSLEQLAFYSVATGFAGIPISLATPFINAAMPSIFAERGRGIEGARRFTGLSWRYLALIVFPTSVGLLVLSRPLIHVLYGPQYHAAAPVLVYAMALGLIPPLVTPANSFVAAENGQKLLVRWNIAAALLVLGLDWVMIRWFCSTGAAIADGLGRTIATVGVWLIAARWYKLKLPYGFAARLLLACLIMAASVLPIVWLLPQLLAIILGPLVGAIGFIVGLRIARVLDDEDADRLRILEKAFPGKTREVFLVVLAWMSRTSLA